MSQNQFDIIIIGSGIAGLSAAIKLAEEKKSVAIITREEKPEINNTFYAQGGIIFPDKCDEELIDDIIRASAESASYEAAKLLVEKSPQVLREILLDKVKTPLARNSDGSLKFTKEAAHSKARIIYQGDYTGRSILISMLNYLNDKNRFPNVTFLTSHTAIDLITPSHHGISIKQRYEKEQVIGVYALDQKSGIVKKLLAKKTILATGGIASLYLNHTNSEGSRGDGHAMARRAGATLTNMEFIQFHPTTFFDRSSHRRFLISEAVRGEGGRLIDDSGRSFMNKYHPDEELAPRDVVARAIAEEMIENRHECVYLDISFKKASWLKDRFPTIYEHCLEKRVDITSMPIPVVPAAHYACGGVKTDLVGKTTLDSLYAVGEVACTGLHGANRLASTSLLEGLTFGHQAALDILKIINDKNLYDPTQIKEWELGEEDIETALLNQDWLTLKQTMWNYVGIVRSSTRLKRAKAMFGELSLEIERFYKNSKLSDQLIGLRNGVEVGQSVVHASLINRESLGSFYRKD